RDSAPLTLAVATGLLFVLASRSARHIPEFVLCAVPTIATLHWKSHQLERISARERSMVIPNAVLLGLTCAGAALFVVHAWRTPLPRLRWKPLSDDTLASIAACSGPLYNRYDEGGYV